MHPNKTLFIKTEGRLDLTCELLFANSWSRVTAGYRKWALKCKLGTAEG